MRRLLLFAALGAGVWLFTACDGPPTCLPDGSCIWPVNDDVNPHGTPAQHANIFGVLTAQPWVNINIDANDYAFADICEFHPDRVYVPGTGSYKCKVMDWGIEPPWDNERGIGYVQSDGDWWYSNTWNGTNTYSGDWNP